MDGYGAEEIGFLFVGGRLGCGDGDGVEVEVEGVRCGRVWFFGGIEAGG